jgi:hypothetical protein
VPLERPLELPAGGTRLEVELGIQCVEAEEVTVGAVTAWRTRARVAGNTEAVPTLARRSLAFADAARGGIDAPGEPVIDGTGGGVRVIHDQGERTRSLRNTREQSCGETFSPSHVWRRGMSSPSPKALVAISSPAIACYTAERALSRSSTPSTSRTPPKVA